jgi:hypothetical protein
MTALSGQEGPWGGKLKIGRAHGESGKPDERKNWAAARGKDLSPTTDAATVETTATAAA